MLILHTFVFLCFSSGKCQIVHWRQGHKDKCQPAIATCQTDDLVSDLGKKVADPDYRGIHEQRSQTESTEYATSSENPLLSEKSRPNISRAKDDSARDESLQEANVTGSNSELSSNSFSGFSASTGASESSDDSSVCESIISNEHERSEGHIFVDHDTSDTTSSHNNIDESISLSPKFVGLVDSVDDYPAMNKLYQVTPGLGKEESKLTSSDGSFGLRMRKGATIESSTVSSGFLDKNIGSTRLKDDSNSGPLPSQGDSPPKSVENNMPRAGSSSSEKDDADSSGCADAVSSIHNLQIVGSRVSNHVINPGTTLELGGSRVLPRASADTKLVSRAEEHSHYSTKCGNNDIKSGTITSSRVVSSPKPTNDLKTSLLKASDQFRGSKSSKPFPLAVGSNITGKYSAKVTIEQVFYVLLCQ